MPSQHGAPAVHESPPHTAPLAPAGAEPGHEPQSTPPHPLATRWRWAIYPLLAFALTRIGFLAVTGWSLAIDPRLHTPGLPYEHPAIEGLCRWDCGWFLNIMQNGYVEPVYSNFFPLYPLLGRLVAALGIPPILALLFWSNVAGLGALLLIYRLFLEVEGEQPAKTSLALFVAWPFAFFQATGYPESLSLFFSALAIWLALRKRHILAGGALGVGVLARHVTILAGLSLLIAQIRERGIHPIRFVFHRAFIGLILPFAIASLYFVYLWHRFGDPLAWLHARSQGWKDIAWVGIWRYFETDAVWPLHQPEMGAYIALSIVPGIGAFMLLGKRKWWTLAGYAVSLMLFVWAFGLVGLGRYTAACFPAFLPLGVWLAKRPEAATLVVCAFAVIQGMFLYLFTHHYPII